VLKNTTGTEGLELINKIVQTIWSGKLIGQQDFSTLAAGMYFLRIKAQKPTPTIKIIKK